MFRWLWMAALLAACPLMQFLCAIFVGMAPEKVERSPFLRVTFGITASGYSLSTCGLLQRNLWMILLGQIIVGVGSSNSGIINSALADLRHPSDRPINLNFASLLNSLSFAIWPLWGGFGTNMGEMTIPFIVAGLISVLSFVIFIFIFRKNLTVKGFGPAKHLLAGISLKKSLKTILKNPLIRVCFLSLFIFSVGWSFYFEFISVTLVGGYSLGEREIGYFYIYAAVCFAISSGLLIRPILNKFSATNVVSFSLLAIGFSLVPFIWKVNVIIIWLLIPLQQYFLALLFSQAVTAISAIVPKENQEEVLGMLQSLESMVFIVTPLFGGHLVALGSYLPALIGLIAVLISYFLMHWGFRDRGLRSAVNH